MPRIRTVKPETWNSHDFMALSAGGALTWFALISLADDHGRLRTDAEHLHLVAVRRVSPEEIDEQLNLMHELRMIQRYEVDGRTYIQLVNWARHQKVDHAKDSEHPAPPPENPRSHSRRRARAREDSREFSTSRAPADRIEDRGSRIEDQEDPPTPQGVGDVLDEEHDEQPVVAEVVELHRPGGEYERWLAELNAACGRSFRGDGDSRRRFRVVRRDRSLDELMAAARGAAMSPFHRGENDRHTPYQDPITVLRSRQLQTLIDLGQGAIRAAPAEEDWTALSPRAQRYGDAT